MARRRAPRAGVGSGLAPDLQQVLLQPVELPARPLEVVTQWIEVPLEQLAVQADNLRAVARVHPDAVVTHPARQPQALDGMASRAHVHAELPAQVQDALCLVLVAVAESRRRAVPFL